MCVCVGGVSSGVAFGPWSLQPCVVFSAVGFVLLSAASGGGWGSWALPFSPAPSPLSSQLPAPPKFNFHIRDSWNSGRPRSLGLGVAAPDNPSQHPLPPFPGHSSPSFSFLLCAPPADLREDKGWRFQGGGSKIGPPLKTGHFGAHRVTSDKARPCPISASVSPRGTDQAGTGASQRLAELGFPGGAGKWWLSPVAEGTGPSLPTGIIKVMSALSAAPSKACEYSREGWDYLKERIK